MRNNGKIGKLSKISAIIFISEKTVVQRSVTCYSRDRSGRMHRKFAFELRSALVWIDRERARFVSKGGGAENRVAELLLNYLEVHYCTVHAPRVWTNPTVPTCTLRDRGKASPAGRDIDIRHSNRTINDAKATS